MHTPFDDLTLPSRDAVISIESRKPGMSRRFAEPAIAAPTTAIPISPATRAIALFTPDAAVDYTAIGGPDSNPKDVFEHTEKTMSALTSSQHMVASLC